jgi:hypothetical protein
LPNLTLESFLETYPCTVIFIRVKH